MAFCVQCGTKVDDADRFCVKCGAPQKVTPGAGAGPKPSHDPFSGISSRNASLLCYVPWIGWIAAIVVLASERFRQNAQVRFHAFQGLYIFVAWLVVEWVIRPILWVSDSEFGARLLQLVIFAAWVFMMIKVSHDENYKLPIIGDLAERSVSEQRS